MGRLEGTMAETSGFETIFTGLQRVAELARQAPELVFTTLAHHIDLDLLRAAYHASRKDGAVGIDGQTAEAYGQDLETNLRTLLEGFKSGRYRAPAVRRVQIPKGDGRRMRPIGIPTFEDKVLQRAVLWVLEAVYEQDFLDCSYGFRRGRSAHQALECLWKRAMSVGGGFVVDVDLQDFFESLDHAQLRSFLDQRVRDGVLRRMIDKWLKAGVLDEQGQLRRARAGTPQGGVVSPLLANVYLHHVLDLWFTREVEPRLRGPAYLVRYSDDFVIVCAREDDARRVMAVLPKRLERFGLRAHPEKTRLVPFRWPVASDPGSGKRGNRPGTFDFLGFTHYWAKSRKRRFVIKRKTARDRLRRARRNLNVWLRVNRHWSVAEQHRVLCRKLQGHFAYYGITGNSRSLGWFRWTAVTLWRKWLSRRSQCAYISWERMHRLLARYPLPPAVAIHSIYRRGANP
jgi:group II intron reverse transcriptase/maturase